MVDDGPSNRTNGKTMFGVGLGVGVLVGFAVGSVVALRLGDEVVEGARGLLQRLSGRSDRVNFELLLQ